jgi:hypothetical protein
MSENIVWVVDVDATADEAPALAKEALAWLVGESIVQAAPSTDPRLMRSDLYRPGTSAAVWSKQVSDYLLLCGVEITAVRTVFHAGPGPDGIQCPHCGADHAPDNVPWSDAVGAWFDNEPDDMLACPACRSSARIIDWRFLELDWGFGNLGIGFNNWAIQPRLATELARVLGHRTKIVHEHR